MTMVISENNDPVPQERVGKYYYKAVPLFEEDKKIDGKFHEIPLHIFSVRRCPTAAVIKIRSTNVYQHFFVARKFDLNHVLKYNLYFCIITGISYYIL
jgi:hypothetical protein